jgi:farnesyl-diphosphate farnesyltransferase
VADTRVLPRAVRLAHLETLRAAFAGVVTDVSAIATAPTPGDGGSAEAELLARLPEALARLERLPPADRIAVREVLGTLTSGMAFDLTTFPGDDAASLAALATPADLDHYTYLVAGCVGEFWTTIHLAHRARLSRWAVGRMQSEGVRFGKALQMTNVLRDIPRDLRHGRCYVPASALAAHGLAPSDLLDPAAMSKFSPLFAALLEIAAEHYETAWRYTFEIPRAEWRMRVACAWPLLIGEATLAALRRHPNPLAATEPVKISHAAVRAIVARSSVAVWSNRALAAEATRVRGGA